MNDIILQARHSKGFLSTEDLFATIGQRNTILDASVLISKKVVVGHNNTFYPNVVIECREAGSVTIGDNNTFYPGTYILGAGGTIKIAHDNEFGPAGLTIRANVDDAAIVIGGGGRYCDGASIMGKTSLGDGSQVLGAITVQSCTLGKGGSFQEPDPDQRAAVLKGFGLARGITLRTGQVVNGAGNFAEAAVQWQHEYHPRTKDKS